MFVRLTRGGRLAAPVFICALLVAAGCGNDSDPIALANSHPSKDEAVLGFLKALEARDPNALALQAVSESEFLKSIWPKLPASRPDVGMPAERAWADQAQKNQAFLAQVLAEHGGHRYELISASFSGPATQYEGFTIHPKTRLDVREDGQPRTVRLFGSMIESGGRWKIYSFVVD